MPLRRRDAGLPRSVEALPRRHVLFSVGRITYALETRHVRRAARVVGSLGAEVEAPEGAYSLLDLRHLFRCPEASTEDRALLLVQSADLRAALLVDALLNLVTIETAAIVPLPPIFQGMERRWFVGAIPLQGRIVVVVHLDGILNDRDGRGTAPVVAAEPAGV